MSGNNSILKDDWVRLNVGGKVFQTTKDTLSRYPDTFLARLVNSGIPSDKDESGAYLIDADPGHFRTILNYLRRGSVTLDSNKIILGDLLREADFYNIEPLVIEIHHAMSVPDQITVMTNRIVTKMDDMSKKLSSVGTNPMTPKITMMGHHQPMINHQPMIHQKPILHQQPLFRHQPVIHPKPKSYHSSPLYSRKATPRKLAPQQQPKFSPLA